MTLAANGSSSAIGFATSPTGEPVSWHDKGMVYGSRPSDTFNALDPALVVDADGRWWLSFGSFWSGIKMIEINPATGKQAPWNTTRYSLAQRPPPDAIENSYVVRHGGDYYLFASFGFCCRGTDSTYRVMVGRSRHITGPYYDRQGTPMLQGGGRRSSPRMTGSSDPVGRVCSVPRRRREARTFSFTTTTTAMTQACPSSDSTGCGGTTEAGRT
ncbi:MAG: arabinan endo-1,5-alpha-L-arabinosidase [Streptosporangiaceae bacterium]